MSPAPSERELERRLAELPRVSASPGFARRVLAELEAPAAPPRGHGWLLAAGAAALALAVGLWLLPRVAPEPPFAETRALEREHRLLMAELEALKASLEDSEPPPVLYLGGTEGLDVVLDLAPVWQGETTAIRPAAIRDAEPPVADPNRHRGDRR